MLFELCAKYLVKFQLLGLNPGAQGYLFYEKLQDEKLVRLSLPYFWNSKLIIYFEWEATLPEVFNFSNLLQYQHELGISPDSAS